MTPNSDSWLAACLRADVLPEDLDKIVPVRGAVFESRGSVVMAGTNVRVSDVVARFKHGESVAQLAEAWEVGPEFVEAALRTAFRSGRPDP